jgi:lipopolysaccharide export system permease protein
MGRVYNPPRIHYHSGAVRIVDRYILRELLVPFGLGIAIFTSILLIVRILKLVELVVNRGVPLLQILRLFSYILPAFLEVTVPMALLLAILVAFGRLSSDSEIIALRATGVSLYRLMVPVGILACVVAVLTFGLSAYARPWGNGLLREGLYEMVKNRVSAGIKAKVFNDEFAGLVIYIDRIEPPGTQLYDILISDTRDPKLHNTVYARSGTVVSPEGSDTLTLRLADGGIYSTSAKDDGYQATRFTTYDITLDLDLALDELRSKPKEASEMTIAELRRAVAEREKLGEPSWTERVELQRKLSIPFACLVFAALGVPLGIQPSRAVHSRGFSVSLVLIFAYYLLMTLGQNLGERGALPASVAVWLPNVALSIVAVGLLSGAARDANVIGPRLASRWAAKLRSWSGRS